MTVIGLGPMGVALAEAFLAQGHPTTVWNRTPKKGDGLVAKGARRVDTISEAVSASKFVVVCLKDYDAMYAVLDPADEALSGRVLVNHSSGIPEQARNAAIWAAHKGVDYLDGAIMVPPQAVGHPDSVFLYSGPQSLFEAHEKTLLSMGGTRYLGTDPSLAVLYNTALLSLMYSSLQGFLHAAALVGSANVRVTTFAEIAIGWFLPSVVNPYLLMEAPDIDKGNYPGDRGNMVMNMTALDHIFHTSKEQGISSDLPEQLKKLAENAISAGYGDRNFMAVIELLKNPSKES
ncbi:NAD(P)-binding domain-containing protein [Brevibacillus brevis]|uniref:NAD(P)-binding domain-containing protein n=1 Tax=Brevibacillus brevis TaxID=1393 RepID=A0ABY9TED5_BREBE|nr:NAD(P)-binding domain-containing protein [Brevibacillus brevis]WNC17766.1 NAD(P)-binding domain-containing protein [Brevibacillus brevis]